MTAQITLPFLLTISRNDVSQNTRRFFVVKKHTEELSGKNKVFCISMQVWAGSKNQFR